MAQVRYIVDDVEDAIASYVSKLGFELEPLAALKCLKAWI